MNRFSEKFKGVSLGPENKDIIRIFLKNPKR